ncbi:MAG: sulfate reduction electron transfer complex DsrMKJOP subunit DsrM [Planctomycetota bacterium]
MRILVSLLAVLVLLLAAWAGTSLADSAPTRALFGVALPWAAVLVFTGGFVGRIVLWARSPVPFRIPTACGQQKSLPWIRNAPLDNPHTKAGVVGRMALEVLLFRSLFRNTKAEVRNGRVIQGTTVWLWAGALLFHACFAVVLLRHVRFFLDPVPAPVLWLVRLDALMEVGVPALFMSGAGLVAGALFLLLRRLAIPQVRYFSLPADYFPLFLILGIATTGILLRHFVRADITGVKELAMNLAGLDFTAAVEGIHWLAYAHLTFVSVLVIYFPFSKLMHMGGVFLSPTRNMANNNRRVRHVNPWDYPVPVHTYAEYEEEFRDKMEAAGLPLEKEPVGPR